MTPLDNTRFGAYTQAPVVLLLLENQAYYIYQNMLQL